MAGVVGSNPTRPILIMTWQILESAMLHRQEYNDDDVSDPLSNFLYALRAPRDRDNTPGDLGCSWITLGLTEIPGFSDKDRELDLFGRNEI
jgi:hypothetical protein